MSFWGPDTFNAFGHVGFINVMGWADPERRITVGLMTSGKPLLYPEMAHFAAISREIGLACPKEPGFDWWDALSRAERERSSGGSAPRRTASAAPRSAS